MHFGCVDFPKELLDARAAGSLVIFTGAGVSKPSPSSLPLFDELALELAQGTRKPDKDEPLDRFLGLLDRDKGLRIHDRACEVLSNPASRPNPLHFDLLRLFNAPPHVRLVTTNFDDHFGTAARELWPGNPPEFFSAPALPMGGDFSGLVHIHGSVTRSARRMVLTDADFGKAYLTEGWARRFLQELFLSKCSVLFVGYSHNDPVMHYLARGLPPATAGKRFALTDGERAMWEHRGITPILYKNGAHLELAKAIQEWAGYASERPLDKRSRIREIASKAPPVAGVEHDYLVESLNDVSTARFFTEFALKPEYFGWVCEREAFRRLFRRGDVSRETDWPVAAWFAERFAIDHAGASLEWIAANQLTLGPAIWQAVTHVLSQRVSAGGCSAFAKWLPLLIQTDPLSGNDGLRMLLSQCRFPDYRTEAVLLFEYLLRPSIELKPDRLKKCVDPDALPDIDIELSITGDGYSVSQAWESYFQPNLESFAGPLASISAAHLEQAALLSTTYGHYWDDVSNRVPRLSALNLTTERTGLGILVAVARDTLIWLVENDRACGVGLIALWWRGRSLVLRRLAVFGIARLPDWTAEQRLKWLLDRDLIHMQGFGDEVWSVLNNSFPDATTETKDGSSMRFWLSPALRSKKTGTG